VQGTKIGAAAIWRVKPFNTPNFRSKKEVKNGKDSRTRKQLYPGMDWKANDSGGTRPFIPAESGSGWIWGCEEVPTFL